MQQIISFVFIISLFSGCTLINSSNDSFKFKYLQSTSTTNFNDLTHNLLQDIVPTLKTIKFYNKNLTSLYVTDFVNLENLDNNSKLGFILSDSLKTNVTQDTTWMIKEIEFSKYLSLGTNGTKLLSRNPHQIKNTRIDDNTYALIGTYVITQRQLMVYLKLINLKTGVIVKSSTKRLTLTDEIKDLEDKQSATQPIIYQPMVL